MPTTSGPLHTPAARAKGTCGRHRAADSPGPAATRCDGLLLTALNAHPPRTDQAPRRRPAEPAAPATGPAPGRPHTTDPATHPPTRRRRPAEL
ncbi:hypothetical protein [Streptomyces sp. NPDC126514]|uniref:hypothetical protein n=1 Tax=Streptomyces sp. NPDC126514 TaxID=3155210 RepID=UPI003333F950